MKKQPNPDCELCGGTGMIVKDEFQHDAPACHECFPPEEMVKKKRLDELREHYDPLRSKKALDKWFEKFKSENPELFPLPSPPSK